MNLDDIPKEYLSLMKKGICPTCRIPMLRKDGSRSHSKTKALICEEKFREKINVKRTTFNYLGKTYEIDATINLNDKKTD